MIRPLAFAVLAMTVLAGCSGSPLLKPSRPDAYVFDGTYTWATPLAIDANATLLATHPLLSGPSLPRSIEQIVDGSGAESSIGVTSSGAIFVHGLDTLWRSRDQGRTWAPVHEFQQFFAGLMQDTWVTYDPMLHVDPVTDRVFVLQMNPGTLCLYLATSDDEGETWTDDGDIAVAPGFGSCAIPYDDHPKITTAPLGPGTLPGQTTRGYDRIVVVCTNKVVSNQVLGSWCATSFDGGATWAYERPAILPETNCAGINGPPAVHPDGTLVLPAGGLGGVDSLCKRPPMVAVSEDNGLTWTERRMPGEQVQSGLDPDITFTPDGTGYMVYTAQDTFTYVVRSPDKFQTWEGPWRVSPPNAHMDVFGAIASGDDGRIAVAFLSSDSPQDDLGRHFDSNEAKPGTMWHLWTASSIDADSAAPTFVLQQVTPLEDPVQIGCVWIKGGASPTGCRNLLDFIDMAVTSDGRYVVGYTDGCVPRNGCTADPQNANFQSRDTTVAIAMQDQGASLFAANGDLPSLGLVVPPYPKPEAQAEPGGDP